MPRSHVELARDIAAQLREKNPKLTEHESILLASKQLKNAVSGVVRS
jgi:tryptophanyl-tRNA synthetase